MDLFIAVSGVGLLLLFFGLCFGRALLPVRGVWIVIPAKGEGNELEHQIYALLWLQGLGVLRCPICVLDEGLSENGLEIMEHLLQKRPEITFWKDWATPK